MEVGKEGEWGETGRNEVQGGRWKEAEGRKNNYCKKQGWADESRDSKS